MIFWWRFFFNCKKLNLDFLVFFSVIFSGFPNHSAETCVLFLTGINPIGVDVDRLRQVVNRCLEFFHAYVAFDCADWARSVHFHWNYQVNITSSRKKQLLGVTTNWSLYPQAEIGDRAVIYYIYIYPYINLRKTFRGCKMGTESFEAVAQQAWFSVRAFVAIVVFPSL